MRRTHSVVIAVAVILLTIAAPAPGQAPTEVAPVISGPSVVTFGQPATYGAGFAGEITSHQWDLDGSGAFATATGARRSVQATFPKPGSYVIRVRGTGPGGGGELSKSVKVLRPTLAGLEYEPALPRPGQQVKLKLATRSDTGYDPVYYAWKIKGLAPLTRRLTIRRSAAAAAAVRATQGAAAGSYDIELSGGAQPTAVPSLARRFPKAGIYRVEVAVVGANGVQTSVEADIKVGAARDLSQLVTSRRPPSAQVSCTLGGYTQCGAIAITTNPGGKGMPITFSNATADFKWCVEVPTIEGGLTSVARVKLAKVFAKLDLPYPAPELFFEERAFNQQALGGSSVGQNAAVGARNGAHASIQTGTATVCRTFKSQAVSWDFGDGQKITTADPDGTVAPVVQHTYATTGIKPVKLGVRKFYFDLSKFPPQSNEDAFAAAAKEAFTASTQELIDQGILKSYVVTTGADMEVLEADCDGLSVKGIPVKAYTIPGAYQVNPLSDYAEETCFLGFKATGSNKMLWRPIPGARVSLNGIMVEPPSDDTVVVDPTGARLSALNGGNLALTFVDRSVYGYYQFYNVGSTPQIVVPPPAQNAGFGRVVATLPDYAGSLLAQGSLYGFEVSGARIALSPDVSALAKLSFEPRTPLNGATPVVLLGGLTGRAATHTAADFKMDLSDINIGPFRTKNFTLDHYPGDGWLGGGQFALDLGGVSYELNANYLPDTGATATRCSQLGVDAGPSGLALPDAGGFGFAGGAVRGANVIVGPAEIYCFGASFKASPFVLIGLVGARIPPGTNLIGVDVCVLTAVLKNNDTAGGCGAAYKATHGSEVWVAGRGTVTLLNELELGSGGFDIHAGADILKTSGFGRINAEFGPFYIEGGVTGTVVLKPTKGFEFTGEIEIGLGACPACFDVMGIVSSKGIGACADVLAISGGFVYRWGGSLDVFAGCNWGKFSSIRVSRSAAAARVAPFGGIAAVSPKARASADIPVEADKPVSFQVVGTDGAPKVTVTTPDGRRVSSTGTKPYERIGGIGFLTIGPQGAPIPGRTRLGHVDPQTIVTVPKPLGGTYKIDTQPGSPAVKGIRSATRLPSRSVRAKVTGSGSARRLEYFVSPIPGQSVEFLEEGDTVGRKIGGVATGAGGDGSFAFPSGYGLSGPRRIYAIIRQDGIPSQRVLVAGYRAPAPPAVATPKELRTTRAAGGKLRVCWAAVPRALGYDVRVVASDGRVLVARAKSRCAAFSGFDASVGANVSVKAVAPWGTSVTPGVGALTRAPAARAKVLM